MRLVGLKSIGFTNSVDFDLVFYKYVALHRYDEHDTFITSLGTDY